MLWIVDDNSANTPSELGFRHVLAPLDGSKLALAALPTARALANQLGARLITISVARDDDESRRMRRHAVNGLGRGDDDVRIVVGTDPAESIRRLADEVGTCLVCLSSRGRGRVAGAVVGSVARAVIQSSGEPVAVVGPQADRPPALVRSGSRYRRPADWPQPLSVRRLIACVDGSPASEEVLPAASQWAAALNMSLTILTVAADVARASGRGDASAGRFGPADAEQYIAQLAQSWNAPGLEVTSRVAYDPISVASGLKAHLRDEPAGLIALATHARSGMDRIRFGAGAADIVRNSTAPALVVPVATS